MIYNVPLDFLFSISNPDIVPGFELQNKKEVSYDEFKNDISKNGIEEALVILTSSKGIRLETGNHRIYVLKDLGKKSAPCVIKHSNNGYWNLGNGEHIFDKGKI